MCGFVGFTGNVQNRECIIKKMADRIAHRGPDGEGFYLSDSGKSPVALGHRRLSIIDLNEGDQPIFNEDKTLVIVFNGEIYNFKELRTQLKNNGHQFATNSDTEVIIHGYEQWGEDVVDHLRGMFAFVIYDSVNDEIFAARDHFGIKPFYYTITEKGELLFASEIKSFFEHPHFKPEVNSNSLLAYLTLQYNPSEETFFKDVYKLMPAHTMKFSHGNHETKRYWDVDFTQKMQGSFDEIAKELDARVHESVQAHCVSDVEVGSYLSGGVDSSYVTAVQHPNKTFSVGFPGGKEFDETTDAKNLSDILGIENSIIHLTPDDCMNIVEKVQYHLDEPNANLSTLPLFYLSKLASDQVKVVLSGEGADEIFAGYDWYVDSDLTRKYKHLPASFRRGVANWARKRNYFKGQGFLEKASGRPEDYFIGHALVFEAQDAPRFLKPKYANGATVRSYTDPIYAQAQNLCELEKKQYLDFHMWLQGDILLKADKMSMSHSLELRVPFLDKEIVRFAGKIHPSYKVSGDISKAVLRAASKKSLPQEWVKRPKKGFPVPIKNWLREEKYYTQAHDLIATDVATEFFDVDKLLQLLEDHKNGVANNHRKIWTVMVFLAWHKAFFE